MVRVYLSASSLWPHTTMAPYGPHIRDREDLSVNAHNRIIRCEYLPKTILSFQFRELLYLQKSLACKTISDPSAAPSLGWMKSERLSSEWCIIQKKKGGNNLNSVVVCLLIAVVELAWYWQFSSTTTIGGKVAAYFWSVDCFGSLAALWWKAIREPVGSKAK